MWRKVYKTTQERKEDQHRGFFACLVINLPLFLAYAIAEGFIDNRTTVETIRLAAPWVVNIGLLVVALIFRPEFATGYLAFIGALLVGSTLLSVIFLMACFISMAVALPLSFLSDILGQLGLCIVLPVSFLYLLSKIGGAALSGFGRWWGE